MSWLLTSFDLLTGGGAFEVILLERGTNKWSVGAVCLRRPVVRGNYVLFSAEPFFKIDSMKLLITFPMFRYREMLNF